MITVLVVDDDPRLVRALRINLTKPFGMDEFPARPRAVVRRSAPAPDIEDPVA